MKPKPFFLRISLPETRLLPWVLSCIVLFLLPHPLVGETTGTMTIMEDTELVDNHVGNIIIGANPIPP